MAWKTDVGDFMTDPPRKKSRREVQLIGRAARRHLGRYDRWEFRREQLFPGGSKYCVHIESVPRLVGAPTASHFHLGLMCLETGSLFDRRIVRARLSSAL